jgi:hypothetical protein
MSPVRPVPARLGLLAALLALPLSAFAEWRDIPYADVAKIPLMLPRIDPEHILTFKMVAHPGKGLKALPADLRLQVKVGSTIVPVPVAADGRVALPIHQEWADSGAVLQSNQPKGTVSVSMNFDSRTPPGTRMSYAQLGESAPVIERGISEMAGIMSFMAPGVETLVLKFDKAPQTLVLTFPGGKQKSWKSNDKGRIELPWEPKWAKAMVELSAPLAGIEQTLK